MLLQQLINGISVGSIYALLAVGYALIYSILNFTNFAHAIAVTIAAFSCFWFQFLITADLPKGLAVGIIVAVICGILIEALAYRPLLVKKARRLYFMIAGLGVSIMCENLMIIAFSGRVRIYPDSFGDTTVSMGKLSIGLIDLAILIISVVSLVCVELYLQKTRTGLAIRASAFNLEATSLMGVDTGRLILIVFVIASLLAGIAGVLLGAKYTTYTSLGTFMTNKAFIAAVVGGLGSLPGAVIGALILGVSEALVSAYVSTALRDLFAYVILIVVLLIKPSGLLGKAEGDKA
ncbi:MAG: branched-chain amino acid ABC transporter permease [Firmicutes bacterium]|nr:branched-chain amino acid ABC transporter permease [Bacillota bacterium]